MQSNANQEQAARAAEAAAERAAAAVERALAQAERAQAIPQPGQPPVVVQVGPGGPFISRSGSPASLYEAAREARRELMNQLERLEDQRDDLAGELQAPQIAEGSRKGIEARIAGIDTRIADVEKQIAEADANVARAAAVPGAVQQPRPPVRTGPPEEVFVLAGIFMFIVVLPLTIAYARRIWRRGAAVVSTIPQEIYDRFNRLDQAVDSVAIEVERIGEGQRFLTRAYADQRGLGAGPAERVAAPELEAQKQARKSYPDR